MTKNGSTLTVSVSQKSLVEQQNGSAPIAGSSSTRDKMGLSRLVLVGNWIAFALDWDVFYFFDCSWYDTTVFASFKVLFTVLIQAWRKDGVLDFVGPQLMDSHINQTVNQEDFQNDNYAIDSDFPAYRLFSSNSGFTSPLSSLTFTCNPFKIA